MDLRVTSATDVLRLGTAFQAAKTLLAAVSLGVFDALARGPMMLEDVREACGLHPRTALDLLDALVVFGLLDRHAGQYRLSPVAARSLVPDGEEYVGDFLRLADSRLYRLWDDVAATLRTGEPRTAHRPGADLFDTIYEDPAALREFACAMSGLSASSANALAGALPWRAYATVADIGCAQGDALARVLRRNAHLTGVGFDLPGMRPVFEEHVGAGGVADRARFEPGDFFTGPLPEADVLVFGHILHDWDLATKRMLLEKAHQALAPGGLVVVYEAFVDDARRVNDFGLLMSLHMAVRTRGGFDATTADCAAWLLEAGFHDARVVPLTATESAVVAAR